MTHFVLRPLEPADGPTVATLFEQTPDAGQITFTTRFTIDPYLALTALRSDTAGVVAMIPDTGRIVGMAMVDLSHRWVEGEIRPCALLNTLKVHPDYRRQGIAGQMAQWRVDYAYQRLGEETVILADIQKGNIGSQQTARRWCRQSIGQHKTVIMRMRDTPSPLPAGITMRPARQEELGAIVEQHNRFYKEYNLYDPQTDVSLASWRKCSPFASAIRDIYVAVDSTGSLLAGLGVTERARLLSLHVGRLPPAMQFVNRLIRLLPPNGVVDEVLVDQFWFKPGQAAAAHALWEWLRWEKRDRGSVMRIAYDPRGPLHKVLRVPFWLPKGQSTFAVHSPVPLHPERLIYPYGG